MAENGEYTPLTVEEAVERSAAVLDVFVKNGVECLRIGLCESENLHSDALVHSGANHPALGEEVYGELYFRRLREQFERYTTDELRGKTAVIEVPSGEISKAVGQKKKNKLRILGNYPIRNIKFIENSRLTRYNISLTIHDR
jgi:histone acetyltransferase (RNA polymerase elongator complex component)